MTEGEEKKECQKEECCKEECPELKGFHGFGPRCHGRMGFPPMWGMPPCHPHKHKERKCECGEVIPKRKPGEPKIKECPKCKKELPKKHHGFGMRCHKRMKFMQMMAMMGRGPECWDPVISFFPPPPPFGQRLEVHHFIHFGPPPPPPMGRPPFFGPPPPPPMGRPPFFGPPPPPPMGRSPFFGPPLPPPMGKPPCFGPKGPCDKRKCGKGKCCDECTCEEGKCKCPEEKGSCKCPCTKPSCDKEYPCEEGWGQEPWERPPFPWGMGMGRHHMGPPPCGPFGFGPHFGFGPWGPWCKPPYEGPYGKPPCCEKKCEEKKCEKEEEDKKEEEKK